MQKKPKRPVMLIVDDMEVHRVILAQFFQDEFDIREACNGKEALLYIEDHPVHIIMIDLRMPMMDGFDFLARFRQDDRFRGIPVVATTARDDDDSKARAINMGAADFITKPYNPAIVRSRVKNVMARFENAWRRLEQTAQSQQIQEMRRRIERDTLTGLYDRDSFFRNAAAFMQRDPTARYAVVGFHIRYFGVVNELFSVETGHLLLRAAAAYLQHVVRDSGVAGRLKAGDFALCLPADSLDMDAVLQALDDVGRSLGIPSRIRFYAGVYPVSKVFLPVSQMCACAYLAMDANRDRNRGRRAAVYDETLRKAVLEERLILRDMAGALADEQFTICIQPIVDMATGEDASGEVLARWFHPLKKDIPPARFIPIFEKNGFISRLDRFVLNEACRLLALEKARLGRVTPVSVNLSRLDFYDESLVAFLLSRIQTYGLEPGMLMLEITENAYRDNTRLMIDTVARFRKEGFKILMDGFGKGCSSLNMLCDMPVDILKLDLRAIENVGESARSRALLRNVAQFAHDIDMEVVVKGVETKAQLDFLQSIGCTNIQGFYFSHPLPKEAYLDRLEKQRAAR